MPPALYLAWCAAAGNAAATIYWFKFNFSYVGAGLTGLAAIARGLRRTLLIGGVALVPYALGLAAAVGRGGAAWRACSAPACAGARRSRRRRAAARRSVLGLLWLVTSAVAVAGRRALLRSLLPSDPGAALPAGRARRSAGSGSAGWSRRAPLIALCALPALFFFVLATVGRSIAAALDEREPRYDEVAARIAALTAPDERIFVWGNSPQLYVLARRPMGDAVLASATS